MKDHKANPSQGSAMTLDTLPPGVAGVIEAVHAPASAPEWSRLLDEIGFAVGERVEVMVRGGRDARGERVVGVHDAERLVRRVIQV